MLSGGESPNELNNDFNVPFSCAFTGEQKDATEELSWSFFIFATDPFFTSRNDKSCTPITKT